MAKQKYGSDHPMHRIVDAWCLLIEDAKKCKESQFGEDANWAMQIFDGPTAGPNSAWDHNYWSGKGVNAGDGTISPPAFLMTVNKIAEVQQLFGPALYVRNPSVQVTPRKHPIVGPEILGEGMQDPMVIQQYQQMIMQTQMSDGLRSASATVLQEYQNWSQFELDKRRHARKWIAEALLKGMGVMWTELYIPPGGSQAMVGSFYDTVDNLILDPDADEWAGMKWCARRRVDHVYDVEKKFGLKEGALEGKGSLESKYAQSKRSGRGRGSRRRADYDKSKAHDLIEYYEVYSKMGMGDRISSSLKHEFDDFGDYIYLAICKDCEYPLNLPTEALGEDMEDIFLRAQWPIPYWAEHDGWPFTELYFHDHPTQVWPKSHFSFARGELSYLNWSHSFLATKVATACNTIVATVKAADDDIKTAMTKAEGGYSHVELSDLLGKKIQDVISFLDPPPFNPEIWNMHMSVEQNADKRLGLNELMYAGSPQKQMRSAAEANLRGEYASTRPEDFKQKMEHKLSRCCTKEAFAMRWLLQGNDVGSVVGPIGRHVWETLISTTEVEAVVREFDYRIEAGSTQKPNKTALQEKANQAMQSLGPLLQGYWQAMGDPEPMNNLLMFWAGAFDIENIQSFLLKPPPPPQPPQADPAVQEEQRRKEDDHQQRLRHSQEEQEIKNINRITETLSRSNGRET
jgi:hypothetical protein